uniref:Peroxiredoxin-6 n=13 Tax=Neognathae TaxID=8825 RepID=A0A8C9L8C1_PAVCR
MELWVSLFSAGSWTRWPPPTQVVLQFHEGADGLTQHRVAAWPPKRHHLQLHKPGSAGYKASHGAREYQGSKAHNKYQLSSGQARPGRRPPPLRALGQPLPSRGPAPLHGPALNTGKAALRRAAPTGARRAAHTRPHSAARPPAAAPLPLSCVSSRRASRSNSSLLIFCLNQSFRLAQYLRERGAVPWRRRHERGRAAGPHREILTASRSRPAPHSGSSWPPPARSRTSPSRRSTGARRPRSAVKRGAPLRQGRGGGRAQARRPHPPPEPSGAERVLSGPLLSTMPGLLLGDEAPNFEADTTQGPIRFHDFLGDSWGILFSHPRDFTPVCTTELGRAAKLAPEFSKRNVKMIALSIDSVPDHLAWSKDINAYNGDQPVEKLPFPIIADKNRELAVKLGMLDPDERDKDGMPLTARVVFIFGPDKKLKLSILYPATTGRNFDEILRVVDSLQLTAYKKVATPVDWKCGDSVMVVPTLPDEEAKKLFPKGVFTKDLPSGKKYLRYTPQPE